MPKRLTPPLVRHILTAYREEQLSALSAAQELQVSRSHFYRLYTLFLQGCAQGQAQSWVPGLSGGAHRPLWPAEVTELLRKLLSSQPPSSYNAAASEVLRRCHFKTDRASIRRWAQEHHLAPDKPCQHRPKPVKRWQVQHWGALWQYDASPHRWLSLQPRRHVLLNLLDDATRFHVAARLQEAETLLAHLDFLERAFRAHSLPLALYVDYPGFFFTRTPDAFTQLGAALHFYGVALRYAPTPQAKGKIERRHLYYQRRLPALFAAENLFELAGANHLLDQLLPHANAQEVHRELGMTPQAARDLALQQNRSALRPVPACPWWPYVFSQQTPVRVDDDGTIPVGPLAFRSKPPPSLYRPPLPPSRRRPLLPTLGSKP